MPQLTPSMHNEARRFISFLDVWYDRRRKLLLSADVPLASIFDRLRPETMREAADWAGNDAAATTASVRSEGGSSSGWATTYIGSVPGDNTEWSATHLC